MLVESHDSVPWKWATLKYVEIFEETTENDILNPTKICGVSEKIVSDNQLSVIFRNDQRFLVLAGADFLLCRNTDHGCFCPETGIFIGFHAICINDQFWKL